jgi:flagellar M-ring protein FliF
MSFIKNLGNQVSAYTRSQQIALAASAVLAIAVVWGAVYFANRIDYQLLYSELDPQEANAIVQKLQGVNIPFKLSGDGRSVSIPADKVSETRIKLASEGLPTTGRIGFEIFDQTTFGLTNFQEQVNYQRALEGELARSIMTLSEVDAVRVHLVLPKDSLFQSPEDQAKASVILKLKNGRSLSENASQGIVNVVASSVKGLLPERVTLIDYRGKVLSRPESDGASSLTAQQSDVRQRLEAEMTAKIIQILEPALGQGKVRPQVSVAMNFRQVEETTERFDPQGSVVRSAQRQEERQAGRLAVGGIPGARGAQPPPAAAAPAQTAPANGGAAPAPSTATQQQPDALVKQSETTNFEISKSVRHTVEPVATIDHISVAVLIDNKAKPAAEGSPASASEPHSTEDMTKYRELIAAAVGFNPERGDRLTVENITFEETMETPAQPTFIEKQAPLIVTSLRYLVVPVIVLLVYLLFLRPVQKTILAQLSAAPLAAQPARSLPQAPMTVRQLEAQLGPSGSGNVMGAEPRRIDIIRNSVVEQAQRNPENIARLVRTWINEESNR